MHGRPIRRLREAACLAHTVPGTTLRLRTIAGGRGMLVSRHCLGADLDPCALRAAVLARTGERLAGIVGEIELVAGVVHLGGGLYARTGADGGDERWFLTHLAHPQVVAALQECPVREPEGVQLDVVVKPDPELGMCAVRLAGAGSTLDAVSMWMLTACLVEELLLDAMTAPLR